VAEAPVESFSAVETPAPVAAVEAEPVVAAKTEVVVAREPQFVPIRSIDQPSRSQENFTHSHYEKFKADGMLGEFVMTKEGPVAQAKYFQTSTDTYHIQEYHPDGKPVSENDEPEAPKEKVPGPFVASRQHWDPTRSAPPQHGAPEADKLRIKSYENEWDKPRSSNYVAPAFAPPPKQHLWYDMPGASTQAGAPPAKTIFPWEAKPRQVTRVFNDVIPAAPEPQAEEPEVEEEEVYYDSEEGESSADPTEIIQAPVEPPLRTIFPWEQKPRTVTRVFAQDVSPQVRRAPAAAAPEYDVADEADEALVGTEDWKNFVSRENKWDTDPAIKDYVLGLRKRRSQASEPPVSPAVLAEVPPITPNPLPRVAPAADVETEAEQEPEWVRASPFP
jgi:glycogenin glucosyltransferase